MGVAPPAETPSVASPPPSRHHRPLKKKKIRNGQGKRLRQHSLEHPLAAGLDLHRLPRGRILRRLAHLVPALQRLHPRMRADHGNSAQGSDGAEAGRLRYDERQIVLRSRLSDTIPCPFSSSPFHTRIASKPPSSLLCDFMKSC